MPDNDPNSPFFIWGRSKDDRDEPVLLAINKPWLESLESDQLSAALAQHAGHILGYITVSQDGAFEARKVSSGLMSAHSLFRGLKRDLIDHDLDKRRYVYILNPVRDYGYERSIRGQRANIVHPKPLDSVFGVYAEFGEEAVEKAREWYGDFLP